MPKNMVNLSVGFEDSNRIDPAGMCVLYTDENKDKHIQNLILGDKAELIYKLLTMQSASYMIREERVDDYHNKVEIVYCK